MHSPENRPDDHASAVPANDPFELLGLAARFDLETRAIRQAVLRRTATFHPDRFTDPVEQADAARRLSAINEAERTLLDDEARANALLARLGGPNPSEDRTLPDGFLVEMLSTREEMEAAVTSSDRDALERLERWANDERRTLRARVGELLAGADADGVVPRERRIEARHVLNQWRYLERMLEQLDPDGSPPHS